MTALIAVSLALAVTRPARAGRASPPGSPRARSTRPSSCVVPLVVAGWGQWRRLGDLARARGRSPSSRRARTSSSTRTRPGRTRRRVQRLAREGWLGFEHDSWALFSFTGKLWDGLRPRARDRRDRPRRSRSTAARRTDLILAVLRARLPRRPADDPRALRPLRAAARPAARGARRAGSGSSRRSRSACLIVPLVWAIGDDVRLTRTDTRAVAHALDRPARPAARDGRRRILDAAARGPPDRRPRPARARGGRSTPTATSRGFAPRASTTRSSPARSPTASSPPATATRRRRVSTTSCEPARSGSTMWKRGTD